MLNNTNNNPGTEGVHKPCHKQKNILLLVLFLTLFLTFVLDHSIDRSGQLRGDISPFLNQRRTNRTITCLGGSSTAGGGLSAGDEHAYPYYLSLLLGTKVFNMGHGTTNTLYTALNFQNLVHPSSSIITWEFAINDWYYDCEANRDSLLFFIDQVKHMDKPPTLVFILLWNTPFTIPTEQDVKHCLMPLLKDQLIIDVNDWVLSECTMNRDCKNKDFVADRHHMNDRAHKYVANELQRIILHTPLGFRPLGTDNQKDTLFSQFKRPLLSFTNLFDTPTTLKINDNRLKFKLYGKNAPYRLDSQRALILPPCSRPYQMNTALLKIKYVLLGSIEGDVKEVKIRSNNNLEFTAVHIKIADYHAYYEHWFQPSRSTPTAAIYICADAFVSVRWMTVLHESTETNITRTSQFSAV